MEAMPPAEHRHKSRWFRLLPFVILVVIGLWFLSKQPSGVDLEFVLDERSQGLRSMEILLTLLPDERVVRRTELFFSERNPAPSVIVVRTRLQDGRRYRAELKLFGKSDSPQELSREVTYEGQASLRLNF